MSEAQLAERFGERLGLRFLDVEIVHHDQLAVAGLAAERHLETERADLLVHRRVEVANAGAMGLAATDEDRGPAIAVTLRTAALLAPDLLVGARALRTLTARSGGATLLSVFPTHEFLLYSC